MKVFVHRYKATLILKNKDGWLYEVPERLTGAIKL